VASLLLDASQFRTRVAQEIARSKRSGVTFTVVTFTVVAEYGEHPALTCVRALPSLMEDVRGTDTVCRVEDDCIAALLIDAHVSGSAAAAERLVAGLREHADRWDTRIVEYPGNEDSLAELGLVA
jgi:pyridoxal biosynthesis lyase PdxS